VTPSAAPARRLLREAVGLYWESGLANEVPALAWFLLASLVPLALGITAIAALALGDYAKAQMVAERAAEVLPREVHEQVVQLILRTHRDSPLLIALSIVTMLWTSSGAVGVLERGLVRLLGLPAKGVLIGKLRNIGVAGAVAVLVVLMVLVASAGTGVVRELRLDSALTRVAVPIVSLAITAGICAAVYWVLADGHVRRRSALVGGLTGGVMLLITPTVAGYYLRFVAGNTPVELFLMLAGVLFTCYLAALALLLGAGVTVRSEIGKSLGEEQCPAGLGGTAAGSPDPPPMETRGSG
jgi:uncharacterized BrkB/YihY/UPF0761 family membrane protein